MKPLFAIPTLAASALLASGTFAQETAATEAPEHAAEAAFNRASVIERSPFAKSERGRRNGSGDALELRGFYGAGPGLQVSLTRPDTKESAWIAVGDKNAKWVVETADAEAGTAEVNFDGLKLHLTLAKAEVPEITEAHRGPGGNNRFGGNMSEEGRQALRDAMRSGFEKARTQHPEWFDGRTLNEQQQNERRDYLRAGWEQARQSVAAVSQVDAQQMGSEPPFGGGPPRQQNNEQQQAAIQPPVQSDNSRNNGGNTISTRGNRGNNGNSGNNTSNRGGNRNNSGNNSNRGN